MTDGQQSDPIKVPFSVPFKTYLRHGTLKIYVKIHFTLNVLSHVYAIIYLHNRKFCIHVKTSKVRAIILIINFDNRLLRGYHFLGSDTVGHDDCTFNVV